MEPANHHTETKLCVKDDNEYTDNEWLRLKASRSELEKFILASFKEAKENDCMDKLWEEMSMSWKNDPGIVLCVAEMSCIAACRAPCLRIRDWVKLPRRFQNDLDFAKRFVLFSPYSECTRQAFRQHPVLSIALDFWMQVVSHAPHSQFHSWRWRQFPADNVKSNKAIMLKACLFDEKIPVYADASLWRDRDFVETLLTSNPRANWDSPFPWRPRPRTCALVPMSFLHRRLVAALSWSSTGCGLEPPLRNKKFPMTC
jgi:hypothetical protein